MARVEKQDFVDTDSEARQTILIDWLSMRKGLKIFLGFVDFSPRAIIISWILKSRNSIYKRVILEELS